MDMKINEVLAGNWLQMIRQEFEAQGLPYVDPQITTVKNLHEGRVGKHNGIYIIYLPIEDTTRFYYLGIATGGNTIWNRFQPHYAKLTANLSALYGPIIQRKEPRWQYPKNWRTGVQKYFLDNPEPIPQHFTGRQKKEIIQPANLDWQPRFKPGVNPDVLPVAIWNLNGQDAKAIDNTETGLIRVLRPIFNGSKTRQK